MLYTGLKRIKNLPERQRIIDKLFLLREQLDKEIPEKMAANSLLLATWNIREFGDNRMTESLYYIAEIISRFDIVALQEVASNKVGLSQVMDILGKKWDYIATDSTEGNAGGWECMAFLYDTTKVNFKNLAGEIVLEKKKLINGLQFARTPFCVSFQAGWFKFNLATVHIYYGDNKKVNVQRLAEIDALAKFLKARAKKEDFNYVVLGDFNIPDIDCDYMKALEKNGFHIPDAIKQHPTDLGDTYHYDQIAFNLKIDKSRILFKEKDEDKKPHSGAFNFTKSVYSEEDLSVYRNFFEKEKVQQTLETARKQKEQRIKKENKKKGLPDPVDVVLTDEEIEEAIHYYYMGYWRTLQMSDHLPHWVQLKVDFSNQYLNDLKQQV